jgi:hypothetical protein
MKLIIKFKKRLKIELKKAVQLIKYIKSKFIEIRIKNKTKYFCIGRNKTGTTSLYKAFEELGFVVGYQREAELLMEDCFKEDYERIIKYCKKAEVFQDVPFSFRDTYKILDKEFPNSKFILTVRDSSDQWYTSITKFHAKLFGNGCIPNWIDLNNAEYVYKGWIYNNFINQYGLTEKDNPYDKDVLIAHYEKHNQDVINYFKGRPNDLLIINLSEKEAYLKFCIFIGIVPKRKTFPWENKTDLIK